MGIDSQWHVQLIGRQEDIERLAKLFDVGVVLVAQEGVHRVLEADVFTNLTDASEVKSHADRLLKAMNGAAELELGGHQQVTSGGVTRVDSGGSRHVTVFPDPIRATLSFGGSVHAVATDAEGNVKPPPPPPPGPKKFVEAALTDSLVAQVLSLMVKQHDYFSLYKIYEVIKQDKGGKTRVKQWAWSAPRNPGQ